VVLVDGDNHLIADRMDITGARWGLPSHSLIIEAPVKDPHPAVRA
jgi:hypothetical protein